jgi:acetyl/propionyl-CoA carboxylase alpha subunit
VKKGLDKRVQQALDIVRVVGNDAVHPGQIDLRDDRDTATKLLGLVNLIAEKMITEPKHIEALYGGLPEAKRQAIEKRDKSD